MDEVREKLGGTKKTLSYWGGEVIMEEKRA